MSDLPLSAAYYAMNDNSNGFAVSMRGMGDATDKVTDISAFVQLTLPFLSQYDCFIFIGSATGTGCISYCFTIESPGLCAGFDLRRFRLGRYDVYEGFISSNAAFVLF